MKRLLLISMILGMLPMSMVAQVDDLYFVPKKKTVEKVTDNYGMPSETYYVGSDRSVDDYNRRTFSHYEPITNDSTVSDTISFSAEKGVYPTDSIIGEDFELTKNMSRFEDYQLTDNEAFWAGYAAGRHDWAWHTPWYYGRYGWYSGWYDPWYYYDPLFYGSWGYYGYYGYYGWYSPWTYRWYDPYWYRPWYYGDYYPTYAIGGSSHHYGGPTIGAGTIRRDGSTFGGNRRGASAYNGSRSSELRNRTVNGGSRNGRTSRTNSRTYSDNSRYNGNNYNNSSYSNSRSYSNSGSNSGSFSSSRSSGVGGGGGGSRGGGGRVGGRR